MVHLFYFLEVLQNKTTASMLINWLSTHCNWKNLHFLKELDLEESLSWGHTKYTYLLFVFPCDSAFNTLDKITPSKSLILLLVLLV